MKNLQIFFLISILSFACGQKIEDVNSLGVLDQTAKTKKNQTDCGLMNFRYLISHDHQTSSVVRHIEVFLEDRAFSEVRLKILFSRLSKEYADAKFLVIIVKTNWNQIPFKLKSHNCPGVGSSGGSSNVEKFEYHKASYYRRDDREFFTYNPTLGTSKFKDVIMSGDEIYRNGQWQKK